LLIPLDDVCLLISDDTLELFGLLGFLDEDSFLLFDLPIETLNLTTDFLHVTFVKLKVSFRATAHFFNESLVLVAKLPDSFDLSLCIILNLAHSLIIVFLHISNFRVELHDLIPQVTHL